MVFCILDLKCVQLETAFSPTFYSGHAPKATAMPCHCFPIHKGGGMLVVVEDEQEEWEDKDVDHRMYAISFLEANNSHSLLILFAQPNNRRRRGRDLWTIYRRMKELEEHIQPSSTRSGCMNSECAGGPEGRQLRSVV